MKSSLTLKLKMIAIGIRASIRNINILAKGQSRADNILQLAHRIEKGLAISNPKEMWGWEKAKELELLLKKEDFSQANFAAETGLGVLFAYLQAKMLSNNPEEKKRAEAMLASLPRECVKRDTGGTIALAAEEITLTQSEYDAVKKLFTSRHSLRDCANAEVPQETILQAVQLANHCPSACNRQPYHVYVVSAAEREKLGFKNEFCADKYILVTGRISAFKYNEQNDWIVSASIFAGYLALALHACGVGSCIMRKDLVNETGYNKTMRRFCGIPQNEQIVLELAVGRYKDDFRVPVSNRMAAEDVVRFIK